MKKKIIALTLILCSVLTTLGFIPTKAAVLPKLQITIQPKEKYTRNEEISFNITNTSYKYNVEYRVILYNGTTKKTTNLWNTPKSGYYYRGWQPAGNYDFKIRWSASQLEPGAYSMTVLVREANSSSKYDSYVDTRSFWIVDDKINNDSTEVSSPLFAKVENLAYTIKETVKSTITDNLWGYSAAVAPISEFFDSQGNYNTIYDTEKTITLVKHNSNFSNSTTYTVEKPFPLYGGAVCDSDGNYYVIYGQNDDKDKGDSIVICVVKYDSNFKYLAKVNYTGEETCPYDGIGWGTKNPFRSGNCDSALNANVLVCSYARQMYNGHQSNHVIYVDCKSMTKLNNAGCYTSHSFDQRVITTSDSNYLFADQGDAFNRGFKISKVSSTSTDIWETQFYMSFHFREGANRDYGYNETYFQLGGIAELSTGYVLAGTSEKTLSVETAPTNRDYAGYSEARNLFIQIIDKNFPNRTNEEAQILKTKVRTVTGTKPTSALTKLFLKGDEVDYGVLWLTDYPSQYGAVNPKLIKTDDDRIILMWEKFLYATKDENEKFIDTYYMILSSEGIILQNATSLRGVRLSANEVPVYRDNKVYWSTSDGIDKKLVLHKLYIGETSKLAALRPAKRDSPCAKKRACCIMGGNPIW